MRARRLWLLGCLAIATLAGCGGASSPPIAARTAYSPPASYAAAEKVLPSPESPPPPPVADGDADEPSAAAGPSDRAAEERPGLGTQWGETRESRVHDVTFVRADGDRPFAIASFYYNDRAGVDALARYHGGRTSSSGDYSSRGGVITVSIRDEDGRPLDAFRVGDRTYVVGESGERYSVVLTNHTARRFEAVATVDGLDVVNGRTGDLANRGYVLNPYAVLEIDGFRQSQDTVAAFRFAKVGESYAAKTGDARNVGVIGVALFREQGDDDDDVRTRDSASPFPGRDPRYAQPPR